MQVQAPKPVDRTPGEVTMAKRPCIRCGAVTTGTRCPTCTSHANRTKMRARGDRYGADHRAQRTAWASIVAAGGVTCSRCPRLIQPDEPWALDHRPWGSEPSHVLCNAQAGARAEP